MSKKPLSSLSAGARNTWSAAAISKLLEDLINAESVVKFRRLDASKSNINIQFYCEGGWRTVPEESYLDEIQKWCEETKCGKRMSFDVFSFKNEKEYMMFVLRWQ